MQPVKYYYEAYDNRDRPEDEQGYAEVSPMSAKDQSVITNDLISQSLAGGKKKIKIDHAGKSLQLNRVHCPKAFNLKCPLTGEDFEELSIDDIYKMPQFKDLYEELSNAVGDISQLSEGVKKS